MPAKLSPINSYRLPWFMFDIQNRQLITSPIAPSDISDRKDVVLAEQAVPGLNYAPISPGGGGNRKLSFTLQLISRNRTVGNVLLLKQFERLRNQQDRLFGLRPGQFTPNPRVLYFWGTGSVPLVYWVKKCDMVHKQGWVNQAGQPQYSDIEFELWLDETHPLYKGEELFRKVSAFLGQGFALGQQIDAALDRRPY